MKSMLSALSLVAAAAAQYCSQETVYTTLTNTITFTVPAHTPTPVVPDSTTVIVETVYITPSPAPYYPFPNGTFNYTARHPTTLTTLSFALPSFSVVDSEVPSATPDTSVASPAPVPTSQPVYSQPAVIPTSQAPAAPSSSVPETPASSSAPSTPATGGAVVDAAAGNSGEATFYGGNTAGGMCSFNGYTIPAGIYGTALSDSNWDGGANCGACIAVKGPNGNTIKAMITDQCPGCGTNHLDLYPDAFAALASPSKGVINVSWSIVPCGITPPLVLKNKEGTSPYWFSMQVQNANEPVLKLEVSTDSGKSWKSTTRKDYNYFENSSGFGTSSVDVKVTSVNGGTVVVKGVSIAASTTKTADSNFS